MNWNMVMKAPAFALLSLTRVTTAQVAPQNPVQLRITSTPIVMSDIWSMDLKWLSGGFGFDNIIGLPMADLTKDIDALLSMGGAIVSNTAAQSSSEYTPLTCASGAAPTVGIQTGAQSNIASPVPIVYGATPDNPNFPPPAWTFAENFSFLDGTPLCFSWPILGESVNRTDIRVTLNTGEQFFPNGISTLPNQEMNEKHCIVIFMNLGNRIVPDGTNDCTMRSQATNSPNSCALYPKLFEIVGDLFFVGPPEGASIEDGPWGQDDVQLKNGKGLSFEGWPNGPHPYVERSGPVLIGAHLSRMGDTSLGDDAANDCAAVFPAEMCQYRLRFYYSGGYTPNGSSAIRPTDYADHWRLIGLDADGNEVALELANQEYSVGTNNGGRVTVVGLADLGPAAPPIDDCVNKGSQDVPPRVDPVTGGCYDRCYTEDFDNYIDIILTGDDEGMKSIIRLEQPADGTGCYREFYETGVWQPCVGKQPLYNPGGGGNVVNNDPYFGNYVAASPLNHAIDVVVDLDNRMFVSYNASMAASSAAATDDATQPPSMDPGRETPVPNENGGGTDAPSSDSAVLSTAPTSSQSCSMPRVSSALVVVAASGVLLMMFVSSC